MAEHRIALVIALSIAALSASGCGRSQTSSVASTNAQYVVLESNDQPLREDFNRDVGYVKLMFVVDPQCPECLRGLADLGDDLLSKLPKDARVKVYVINESVIGGSPRDIPGAAKLLRTGVARQYWNPSGDFGRQMSHALNFWNGKRWVYVWDTYLLYPADARWTENNPPQASLAMQQLDSLRGDPKIPWLNSRVFADRVNAMLAKLNEIGATR